MYRADNELHLARNTHGGGTTFKKTFTEFYKEASDIVASGNLDMSTLNILKQTA